MRLQTCALALGAASTAAGVQDQKVLNGGHGSGKSILDQVLDIDFDAWAKPLEKTFGHILIRLFTVLRGRPSHRSGLHIDASSCCCSGRSAGDSSSQSAKTETMTFPGVHGKFVRPVHSHGGVGPPRAPPARSE